MKITRHSSNTQILPQAEKETTVFIKTATPYVSALKRIDKILEKFEKSHPRKKFQGGEYKKIKYVRVKGMGKAIEKVLSVGVHYQQREHKVDVYTETINVVDEVKQKKYETKDDESDDESELRGRSVGCVEVKVWLKQKSA